MVKIGAELITEVKPQIKLGIRFFGPPCMQVFLIFVQLFFDCTVSLCLCCLWC